MRMTALHFPFNSFQDEASGGNEEITQEMDRKFLLASQSTPDATAAFKRAKLIWLPLRIILFLPLYKVLNRI